MLLANQLNLFPITHLTRTTHLQLHNKVPISSSSSTLFNNLSLITKTQNYPLTLKRFSAQNAITVTSGDDEDDSIKSLKSVVKEEKVEGKSFWGAVSLIIGTAIGPGMLGLPSATIKLGPLPSSIVIILSWVYVISSILLVAELSYAAMEEDKVGEVSFTSVARNELGDHFTIFIAVIYAFLCFALLIACVSGVGSIINQWFPWMGPVLSHALCPAIVGTVIGFFPFEAIDATNRFLCIIKVFTIIALVATGLSLGRTNLISSMAYASWNPSSILPAIPITVLTLGFHIITPFVCKVVGKTVFEARKAILCGGIVPLLMVLSWNLVVLGIAETNKASSKDPISLLLSVNSSILPAVQGFVFSALATGVIGYAISFPKQLIDTFELIFGKTDSKNNYFQLGSSKGGTGRVGFLVFMKGKNMGTYGEVSFNGSRCVSDSEAVKKSSTVGISLVNNFVMTFVLVCSVLIASSFPAAFSKALDFAGIYANCFLFGILPPLMAWIHRSKKRLRSNKNGDFIILPGGDGALLVLFGIAVILGVWH